MFKQFLYFFITASVMYSLLVTYTLISNNQFNNDYMWCLVNAIVTALVTSVAVYFFNKKNKSKK